MIDVFPEHFREVDYSNLQDAVKQIEQRVRYGEECLDYAIRTTTKAVEKGGTSPGEVVQRLYAVEAAVVDIRTSVSNLQTAVTRISQASKSMETKTGNVPPTGTTVGAIGQLYIDTFSHDLYYCSDNTGLYYIWTKLN